MKTVRWSLILLLGCILLGCAGGKTYFLLLRYQPTKQFPSLQQQIGQNLALAPLKDQRPDTLYVGLHAPLTGNFLYFKSDPSPLEKAVMESLPPVLSSHGIKVVSVPSWDGKPDSLKNVDADSVLMIEIKALWTEGKASLLGTNVRSTARFVFHLGVKKEGKVFTRNVDLEREMTVASFTQEKAEQILNQMLGDVFDSYLSNPY